MFQEIGFIGVVNNGLPTKFNLIYCIMAIHKLLNEMQTVLGLWTRQFAYHKLWDQHNPTTQIMFSQKKKENEETIISNMQYRTI